MAVRITPTELKDVIDTEITETRLSAFITAANQVVNKLLLNDFDEAQLKEIERWLAAHFVAANIERQAIVEKAGPAEQRFSDNFGMHLESTTYGQTVSALDTTGKIAGLGKKKIVLKAITRK